MREYMKKRTGFWKKAFYDGEPEIPSYLIKALQSIKYGNILMVRAPISAAIGNATMLALKPINMFAGSVGRGNTKKCCGRLVDLERTWDVDSKRSVVNGVK